MFTPYIRFNGNCEEAFLWYAQVSTEKYNTYPDTAIALLIQTFSQLIS